MSKPNDGPFWRSRWWMPAFALALGLVILAAAWVGDRTADGVRGLVVMTVLAVVFAVFGGRSDTLAGIAGPGRDERWDMIDLRASWFGGVVLLFCVLGAWLYELARGRDGEPYSQLAAIAGVAYVLALAVLRRRG